MTPDQMQDAEREAALLAVAHSLTEAERVLFLGRVARSYPRLNGADVADVLELTVDHDMFLDQTEPFFERFGDQLPDGVNYAPVFVAHVIILLKRKLTPGRAWSVMQRAGVVDAPRFPEVEVGLLVHAADVGGAACGTDANTVTLRARAEQGMRAAGISEDVITEFRESARRTDIPGQQFNVGDIASWVTLVDRYTETPRKVYDPVHDLTVVVAWATGSTDPVALSGLAGAAANLRSHLDLRSVETARASLAAFFGREPE
jgi:hypothetical protein